MELFRGDYKTVLSVRPGITDYAAIEYRNEEEVLGKLSAGGKQQAAGGYSSVHAAYVAEVLPAKIALYKKYIAEQSFLTDLKILARTALRLVS